MVDDKVFVTARSGLPSPSRSPMATLCGDKPVTRSVFAAKAIVPVVPVFLKTDTVLDKKLLTARSALPSPSRSPMATDQGALPVANSTRGANEMVPGVLVFR